MTGDGIRRVALTDAVKACLKVRRLKAMDEADEIYNQGVKDCIKAIAGLAAPEPE